MPFSPAFLSDSTVCSRSRGKNDTHRSPRMRSVVSAASMTIGLRLNGCSGLGTP